MLSRGKRITVRILSAAIALCLAAGLRVNAQKSSSAATSAIRVDSTLVLIPVTVVDRRGAIVNGLRQDAFTLTEDGVRQQICVFGEADVPVSMGVVLDLSGSMKPVLGSAKESLRALMKGANPEDEAFLNAVSTSPRRYSTFTQNFDDILNRIAFEKAYGYTALFDTIYASLEQLRAGVQSRMALLVISDGMDNRSRYSRQELLGLAVESGAQVYTISPDNAAGFAKPVEATEERQGLQFLAELAAKTGGLSFVVRAQSDIAAAAEKIGRALRNQYTLGYAPLRIDRDGKWRRIKVQVADPRMKAYARTGYRFY